MENCPHCQTEIPQGATVCRGCGAQKAYGINHKNGAPLNVGNLIGMCIGSLIPLAIVAAIAYFILGGVAPQYQNWAWITPLGLWGLYSVFVVINIATGPRWYRTTHGTG